MLHKDRIIVGTAKCYIVHSNLARCLFPLDVSHPANWTPLHDREAYGTEAIYQGAALDRQLIGEKFENGSAIPLSELRVPSYTNRGLTAFDQSRRCSKAVRMPAMSQTKPTKPILARDPSSDA